MAEQHPNQPQMTVMAGRPIKVLYKPQSDILIACRTAQGEDVHVPLSALAELLMPEMVSKLRTSTGARL